MLPYVLPSTHLRTSWNTRSAGFNSGLYGGWMMVASPTLREGTAKVVSYEG